MLGEHRYVATKSSSDVDIRGRTYFRGLKSYGMIITMRSVANRCESSWMMDWGNMPVGGDMSLSRALIRLILEVVTPLRSRVI